MPSDVLGHRYSAFISYRHADNREEGRRWADWLHRFLETYEVPPRLVGKSNSRGEVIPSSLYPVFRDELELPADADLSQPIQHALASSAALIVLCSPRAVESYYVGEEIRAYKESGKTDRVLALIVDGEPHADDPKKLATGISPEAECLPERLCHGAPDEDGVLDWSLRADPTAADVRPEGRPEQGWTQAKAYRAALHQAEPALGSNALRQMERDYDEALRLAKLKLIAGVLAIPLEELAQHDKEHQALKLRRRLFAYGLTGAMVLAAVMVALWQSSLASRKGAEARIAVARHAQTLSAASLRDFDIAQASFSKGEWRRGLSYLARCLQTDPDYAVAAFSFWSQVVYGRGDRDSLPLHRLPHSSAVSSAIFSPDGAWVLTASADNAAHLFDAHTGQEIRRFSQPTGVLDAVFNRDGSRILTAAVDRTVRLWDCRTGAPIGAPYQCAANLKSLTWSPDESRVLLLTNRGPELLEYPAMTALARPAAPRENALPPSARNHSFKSVAYRPDSEEFAAVGELEIAFFDGKTGLPDTKVKGESNAPHAITAYRSDGRGAPESKSSGEAISYSRDGREWLVVSSARSNPGSFDARIAIGSTIAIYTLQSAPGRIVGLPGPANAQPGETSTILFRAQVASMKRQDKVKSACFSPDGRLVLGGCADGPALVWMRSGLQRNGPKRKRNEQANGNTEPAPSLVLQLEHPQGLSTAIFSPDGWRMLTVCDDRVVRVWDTATGDLVAAYRPIGGVRTAVFSTDGTHVLTLSGDNIVLVWDTAGLPSGESCPPPSTPPIDHAPDGQRYLTVEGRSARLWETETKRTLGPPLLHSQKVIAAGFSPDGLSAITTDSERVSRRWPLPSAIPIVPDQIAQIARVLSGLKFTDQNTLEEMGLAERMAAAGEGRDLPAESTFWGAVAHWSIHRDSLQPLLPGSGVSRRQAADALISAHREGEARTLDPANPNLSHDPSRGGPIPTSNIPN